MPMNDTDLQIPDRDHLHAKDGVQVLGVGKDLARNLHMHTCVCSMRSQRLHVQEDAKVSAEHVVAPANAPHALVT